MLWTMASHLGASEGRAAVGNARRLARLAAEHGPDMLVVVDPAGVIRFVGRSADRILGIDPRRHPDAHLLQFVHPDDRAAVLATIDHVRRRPGYHKPVMVRVRRADDGWVDCEANCQTIESIDGIWAIMSIRGVRDRNQVDERRAALERLIRTASLECARVRWFEADDVVEHLLRSLGGVLGAREIELAWVADEGDPRSGLVLGAHWAAMAEDAWGRSEPPSLGSAFGTLSDEASAPQVNLIDVVECTSPSLGPVAKHLLGSGLHWAVELRLSPGLRSAVMRLGFESFPERWDSHNADVVMILATTMMSTLRRCQAEELLNERARRDPLTGLLNREEFYRSLASWMGSSRQRGRIGVLYLDVDDFKRLNDDNGHAAGDALLRGVAKAMEDSVREGDVVARMGGDEFVAVCRDLDRPEQLDSIARRVADRVERLDVASRPVVVSIGSVVWDDESDADELVGAADAAMYRQKRLRRSSAD